jgi:hypothetical protein
MSLPEGVTLAHPNELYIGGRWVAATAGGRIEVVSLDLADSLLSRPAIEGCFVFRPARNNATDSRRPDAPPPQRTHAS